MESAFDTALTEAEHLEVIERKTGSLFELPCRLGAYLAGCPANIIDSLGAYGRHLGVAFQLADDALDFLGDPDELGKDPRADLPKGVYSLPVLRVLRDPSIRSERLMDLLGQLHPTRPQLEQAVDLVRTSGTVEETLALARERAGAASGALAALPEAASRASLEALASFAVRRRA
jgi:geranylgeranyl pyrophosphate synthase